MVNCCQFCYNFAYRFTVRRYTLVPLPAAAPCAGMPVCFLHVRQGLTLVHFSAQPEPFLTLKISPKRIITPSTPAINNP